MESSRFPFAAWDEQRRPMDDEALDDARRARYWDWSSVGLFEDVGTRLVHELPDGRAWHELEDVRSADYEAFHMQHSIGYNWDHYSRMGRLLSLRGSNGVPSVTVLVTDGVVVHARRRQNEPLTDADLIQVRELAQLQGWATLPEEQL